MNKNRILVLMLFMILALQTGYAQEDIVIHCDEENATYYEQCYYDSLVYMDEKMQNDPDEYYRTWANYYESMTDEERAEQIKIGNQVLCYPDETDISRERAREQERLAMPYWNSFGKSKKKNYPIIMQIRFVF